MYQFILLHSRDYLKKLWFQSTLQLMKAIAEMKCDTEEGMEFE